MHSCVDHCTDCHFVNKMKSENPSEEYLTQIKDSDVPAVLNFSDSKHLGYKEVCKRIKSWCDFPTFEKRVSESFQTHIIVYGRGAKK